MALRPVPLLLLAAGLLVAGGCRRAPAAGTAAAKGGGTAGPPAAGTARGMDEAEGSRYAPPADGRLTARQVEMYIEVRRRGREIRQQALTAASRQPPGATTETKPAGKVDRFATLRALGRVDDAETAERRAARERGANFREYEWVKARVLDARMAVARRTLEARLASGRAQYIAMLETKRRQTQDEVLKADFDGQIADFRRQTRRAEPRLPLEVQKNAELLERYRDRLDAAEAPLLLPGTRGAGGEKKDTWNRR